MYIIENISTAASSLHNWSVMCPSHFGRVRITSPLSQSRVRVI